MSKEFKVGLLAIVAGSTLYIGFNFLKGIDLFSNTHKYYAFYENIDGLAVSNPVRLNGYDVGRVSDINIVQEQNNIVKVEFDIQKRLVIGQSTQAELTTDLLGSKSVVLKMKDGDTPLESGGTIQGTVEQGLMETLLDSTDPLKSTIIKVNELLIGFSDSKLKLDSALVNFTKTAQKINRALDQNQRNILKITDDLSELTGILKDEQDGVKPLLANVNTITDSLKVLELSRTVDNLNKTLSSLKSTMDKVNNGAGSMAKFMNDDSLYTNLNHTAEDLDKLLIDFRENPKRYVHFSLFGKKDK
ncbi:MlaD family protein [Fulvivirgaceae bacterium BMA12]|uniref:MlaD family protein n=1 Tax=Agaribacillus aureus TaxID=3051825 RepID=A0ABT8LJK9_9BACT|nr:MlaD family protein [Fulvivirgaceae bacterium BMA12]